MKLFGPNYGRGQASLGRDPTDPTAVSRAQFAVASAETGVGTATANAGEAIARAGSIQANTGETMVRTGSIMAQEITVKGQIGKALHQTAEVFDAWDKASDQVRANTALAGYVRGTTELMDKLKTQPFVKAADLPDGFLKPNDTREQIPTWEVSPRLYDQAERELYKEAMSGVTRVEHRQELAVQFATKQASNASAIRNHYISENLKDMKGKDEESIRQLVQSGKPQDAVSVIENGFKAGTWNAVERIQKIEKVWHDDEDLRTAKRIGATNNPTRLEDFASEILFMDKSRLTPDERRAYSNQALSKADSIRKADETQRQRKERDESKRVLGDLATRIRLDGYIPTRKELDDAKAAMIPADYLALVALVDRKDGNGQLKPDQTTVRELSLQIMGLGKADASGLSSTARADMLMDRLMLAFADRKLDQPTHEKLVAMLERYRDRPLKRSPEHAMAEEFIEGNLLPPKGWMQGFTAGELTRFGALSIEMKLELNEATRKDPKLDPMQWARRNMPRYKDLAESQIYKSLYDLGLGSYAKTTGDKFDTTATRAALGAAYREHMISETKFKQAVDALSLVPPSAPAANKAKPGQKDSREQR
jgi:hypothetical protein